MAAVRFQDGTKRDDSAVVAVLGATWPLLLDFDGPVTPMFVGGRNLMVSDLMRAQIPKGIAVPVEINATVDPLAVLRWCTRYAPADVAAAVEAAGARGELRAVAESALTPGAGELLAACRVVGRPVAIVSNNAIEAIEAFLDRHGLRTSVDHIAARIPGHAELMKPHPDSLIRAITALDAEPERCALVGDAVTDVQASKSIGVRAIGFAKTQRRGLELAQAGAEAIVDSIGALAATIRRIP
ncbi:HAD family hydrolase [Micropruina sonneratiae]|uniref:HAD family hydrolase n=1 Tax=Micropruina sonneratiae TaxID=2986940 RepID=UPI002226CB8E|nr:HAD family phosphatase [Micropruina sp. KQZ13P-5]MCW3158635.1 HAD family phosphatase [Micropruina sp. KQZ13P-5]